MAAPIEVRNELTPSTVAPGGTATWYTEARDPDSATATLSRVVTDSTGTKATMVHAITILDTVTYETPTCDDPRVRLSVDAVDPTVVHVSVSA